MKKLNSRTRDVLKMYYHNIPLSAIGKKYGITKQRVHAIIRQAGKSGQKGRAVNGLLTTVNK